MRVRSYGSAGPLVVVLHGGPGAAGSMAPLARELAARGFRVLEPFQRRAGGEPVTVARHVADLDALIGDETWADAMRLQAEGVHPHAFAAIRCPVLMLHGGHDPHPGPMIEWERCGHDPWNERAAREEFFATLRAWLCAKLTPGV